MTNRREFLGTTLAAITALELPEVPAQRFSAVKDLFDTTAMQSFCDELQQQHPRGRLLYVLDIVGRLLFTFHWHADAIIAKHGEVYYREKAAGLRQVMVDIAAEIEKIDSAAAAMQ